MKKVIYQLILDESGSMNDCVSETVSGFNEQVQRIKELEERFTNQEVIVNLTVFNHDVKFPIFNGQPSRVKELNNKSYDPGGMTALYDAIGKSIKKVQNQFSPGRNGVQTKVYVVILTDGHENASRSYTDAQISGQIKELEATGSWSFSYLGATPDAVDIAVSLNIARSKSARFYKGNMDASFSQLSESFSKFMTDFDEEDPE